MNTRERIGKLRQLLRDHGLQGLITTREENVYYFTNVRMQAHLLVTDSDCTAVVSPMYEQEAQALSDAWQLIIAQSSVLGASRQLMQRLPARVWGYEPPYVSHADWEKLSRFVDADLRPASEIVDSLRAVKDETEVDLLREANRISHAGLAHARSLLETGVQEKDVAAGIAAYFMRHADGIAFEPIVLFGERTSLPHGRPSRRMLEERDEAVLIDLGAQLGGYHGDLTRTIVRGNADKRWKDIHACVRQLQSLALEALRPGRACEDIDALVRRQADALGFKTNIRHSLGHGIGLAVHEYPALGPKTAARLQENMVVTVEPGLYFPGWGGVRIEDMAKVTEQGGQVLHDFSK